MICILPKYHSGDKIKKNEMDGACSMYGGQKCACRDLVGKSEGKRPLGRPMHRWEENIKWLFKKLDWGGGGCAWTGLIWLRTGTDVGLL